MRRGISEIFQLCCEQDKTGESWWHNAKCLNTRSKYLLIWGSCKTLSLPSANIWRQWPVMWLLIGPAAFHVLKMFFLIFLKMNAPVANQSPWSHSTDQWEVCCRILKVFHVAFICFQWSDCEVRNGVEFANQIFQQLTAWYAMVCCVFRYLMFALFSLKLRLCWLAELMTMNFHEAF